MSTQIPNHLAGVAPELLGFDPRTRNPADFGRPNFIKLMYYRVAPAVLPSPYINFCDLSHWNYVPDSAWEAMANAGWDTVMLKVSEGIDIIDSTFAHRWPLALAAGLYIIPYHFFRCDHYGDAQANYLIGALQPLLDATGGRIMPLVGDFETTDGMTLATRQSRINLFLSTVRNAGFKAAAYSSPGLWTTVAGNMGMNDYGLVAHWTGADNPTWPTGWIAGTDPTKRFGWQRGIWDNYAWCPAVPGCSPDKDVDLFYGDIGDVQALYGDLTVEERLDRLEAAAIAHGWVL